MAEEDFKPVIPVNRISSLPHRVIIKIFSYLPTVEAVRLSLLFKQWKDVWRTLPVLDFSDSRDAAYFRRSDGDNDEREKFLQFVEQCVKAHEANQNISEFKLLIERYGIGPLVSRWLRFASRKNLRKLDLCFRLLDFKLPKDLVSSSSLTSLKLYNFKVQLPTSITLPSLKVLELVRIIIAEQTFIKLLNACSFLEKIHISDCEGLRMLSVEHSSLKFMSYSEEGFSNHQSNVQAMIRTQNLLGFSYAGSLAFKMSMFAPNLMDVTIKFLPRVTYGTSWFTNLKDFLSQFHSAKNIRIICSLTALMFPAEFIKNIKHSMPNLKHIKIETNTLDDEETQLKIRKYWSMIAPSSETCSIDPVQI